MSFEPPKVDKNFFICYFWPRKQTPGNRYAKNNQRRTGPSDARGVRRHGQDTRYGGAGQRALGAERGGLFRTGDAFAVERIALCGITAVPPAREIHKTALGAEQTVAWSYHASTVECLRQLRAEGCEVLAVEQVEGAVSLEAFEPRPGVRYALVFGNEVAGVAQEAVDLCHGAIEIPQAGVKHSINVSVSGGVVLWRFFEKLKN